MADKIQLTLKRSPSGRVAAQQATLRGLGLTKMHKTVVLENTPAVRGMVKKVIHMLEVTEVDC